MVGVIHNGRFIRLSGTLDKSRLRFRLGYPVTVLPTGSIVSVGPWLGYHYGYGYSWPEYGYGASYNGYGGYQQTAPPPAPEPERELTTLEKADLALQSGDETAALRFYSEYLNDNSEDYAIARRLAVTMLAAGKYQSGTALMALTYERKPELAAQALDPGLLGNESELRELLQRVVGYAHRTGNSSAWLTVAVLMQGQGRDALAAKMLARAEAAGGLSENVRDTMQAALTR